MVTVPDLSPRYAMHALNSCWQASHGSPSEMLTKKAVVQNADKKRQAACTALQLPCWISVPSSLQTHNRLSRQGKGVAELTEVSLKPDMTQVMSGSAMEINFHTLQHSKATQALRTYDVSCRLSVAWLKAQAMREMGSYHRCHTFVTWLKGCAEMRYAPLIRRRKHELNS